MVVDYILSQTYEMVDLDETLCTIPSCGHILTVDGHKGLQEHYEFDENNNPQLAKEDSSAPVSAD